MAKGSGLKAYLANKKATGKVAPVKGGKAAKGSKAMAKGGK